MWKFPIISIILCFSAIHAEYNEKAKSIPNTSSIDNASPNSNQNPKNFQTFERLNSDSNNRAKRFLSLNFRQPNKNYQECVTPGGAKGHCKHLRHCGLSAFKKDFWKFFDHFCVIERSAIGVCCPDDISEKTSQLTMALPAAGENDEYIPPWEIQEENGQDDATRQDSADDRGCGVATKQYPKITGGRPADPGEWPWMAALVTNPRDSAFCGGVLITDRHVLTAAHCTSRIKIQNLFVRLGEYDFTVYNETRSRDFRVSEIRQHSDFDPTTYENDIAILKLLRPSLFNSYIWPICMPPLDDTFEGYNGIVTGWGTQFFGGPQSSVLMEVGVPIWTHKQCQDTYTHKIFDNAFCAGAFEGGRDSCLGDSGGPLMVQLPNRRWIVVGIVSWGIRCGEPNHPGIYTRVGPYINWIIENAVF